VVGYRCLAAVDDTSSNQVLHETGREDVALVNLVLHKPSWLQSLPALLFPAWFCKLQRKFAHSLITDCAGSYIFHSLL
jgi:hypothetical protein